MDLRQEIAKRIEELPPDLQQRVLQCVASLSTSTPGGEQGIRLRKFSSSLDPLSAQQMIQAIEDACERIDASEW